ncbi:hypothetical protein F2P81_023123 [Scophthalmus maximus]|uniref:Myelin basic protein n=1 Tax=Scophthalmus maximus TaxID=52904 RepID=A0A6A4RZA2_SCOMX|nr:hypothetical protein F2P81_023123 [Scophthalmus maximus]
MATASTSGQSTFGLGRKKKNPGLMDQISKFFGGEKKKRSKGSFRGHSASSPQQSSARRRTNENAVVHFFRSISDSLLLDDFETARLFMNHNREKPSPVHPLNAGAPSSELSAEDQTNADPAAAGRDDGGDAADRRAADSQPPHMLTH